MSAAASSESSPDLKKEHRNRQNVYGKKKVRLLISSALRTTYAEEQIINSDKELNTQVPSNC